MLTAITRPVSRSITRCELTHLERIPIDLEIARQQHPAYEIALRSLGVEVISLPEEPDLPDSVFVEDTAIVLDECAIITRPGAARGSQRWRWSPRHLPRSASWRGCNPPVPRRRGCAGGGQNRLDRTGGAHQHGWGETGASLPQPVRVHGAHRPGQGMPHLKSAVTQAGGRTLLINPDWVAKSAFPGFGFIDVDPQEPTAANILMVGEQVIYQPAFPHTLERLQAAGLQPLLVDASELGKAEGALTCCSLLFHNP